MMLAAMSMPRVNPQSPFFSQEIRMSYASLKQLTANNPDDQEAFLSLENGEFFDQFDDEEDIAEIVLASKRFKASRDDLLAKDYFNVPQEKLILDDKVHVLVLKKPHLLTPEEFKKILRGSARGFAWACLLEVLFPKKQKIEKKQAAQSENSLGKRFKRALKRVFSKKLAVK